MNIEAISIGADPPREVNVLIEVPIGGEPIKYEMDKAAGTLVVDRFLYTPMRYPGNYGFVPHTLCGDGDLVPIARGLHRYSLGDDRPFVLKDEGFVLDYQVGHFADDGSGHAVFQTPVDESQPKKTLRVFLKYGPDGERVIRHSERMSRPGLRRSRRSRTCCWNRPCRSDRPSFRRGRSSAGAG